MNPESVALFHNAGSLLITVLFIASVWIVIGPMLQGDKKKKRMGVRCQRTRNHAQKPYE